MSDFRRWIKLRARTGERPCLTGNQAAGQEPDHDIERRLAVDHQENKRSENDEACEVSAELWPTDLTTTTGVTPATHEEQRSTFQGRTDSNSSATSPLVEGGRGSGSAHGGPCQQDFASQPPQDRSVRKTTMRAMRWLTWSRTSTDKQSFPIGSRSSFSGLSLSMCSQ